MISGTKLQQDKNYLEHLLPIQPGLQDGLTVMATWASAWARFFPQSKAVTQKVWTCCCFESNGSVFLMLPRKQRATKRGLDIKEKKKRENRNRGLVINKLVWLKAQRNWKHNDNTSRLTETLPFSVHSIWRRKENWQKKWRKSNCGAMSGFPAFRDKGE